MREENLVTINGLTGLPVGKERKQAPFVHRLPVRAFARASEKSKAAAVTLVGIYFIAGLAKETSGLRLPPSQMNQVGATAKIRSKGLSDLEEIGLISIGDRSQGRAPIITILKDAEGQTAP